MNLFEMFGFDGRCTQQILHIKGNAFSTNAPRRRMYDVSTFENRQLCRVTPDVKRMTPTSRADLSAELRLEPAETPRHQPHLTLLAGSRLQVPQDGRDVR